MLHYLIEIAILLLVAYFAGACVGCLLRKLFGGDEAVSSNLSPEVPPVADVAPAAAAMPPAAAAPAMEPVRASVPATPAPAPAVAAEPLTAVGKMERPRGIAAARGGKADNLQRISGVGPKNEKILHGLGFFHFDQIAAWTAEQVNWVDDHLRFGGRIRREEWIKQAQLLADGKEAEFTRLFGTGGLRNKQGAQQSGSRTRKN